MKILFLNNLGAGFADQIDIPEGTTVAQLFEQRVSHGSPADYLIRVNRQPTTSDYVLQPGDRVSVTPTKIEGALRAGIRGERTEVMNDIDQSFYSHVPDPSPLSSPPKERSWEPVSGSTASMQPEF
ncbi:MoaD/ThiS family protein [Planctomicrobium sp. SH527]|uniref:MoaD/ThiS family protein n=1 Tax=Planctomicrobium sp. SH527 TaxID=3448123 RepID=UPI003F5B1350